MKRKFIVFLLPFVLFATAASAQSKISARCSCWNDGYDTYPEPDRPDSSKNQCDLQGMKIDWDDGWNSHQNNKPKDCGR